MASTVAWKSLNTFTTSHRNRFHGETVSSLKFTLQLTLSTFAVDVYQSSESGISTKGSVKSMKNSVSRGRWIFERQNKVQKKCKERTVIMKTSHVVILKEKNLDNGMYGRFAYNQNRECEAKKKKKWEMLAMPKSQFQLIIYSKILNFFYFFICSAYDCIWLLE
jgi:hypothetical protein